jgi:VanZ family protein
MLVAIRTLAWILVIGLIGISVVPAPLRPNTGVWHDVEHFCAFLLVGVVWYLAYAHHLMLWLGSAVAFAAGIELIQTAAPGRHARLSDLAFDALGGCVGILISFVVARRLSGLQGAGLRPRTSASGSRHRGATKRQGPPTSP